MNSLEDFATVDALRLASTGKVVNVMVMERFSAEKTFGQINPCVPEIRVEQRPFPSQFRFQLSRSVINASSRYLIAFIPKPDGPAIGGD